jgi:hypothetical protein
MPSKLSVYNGALLALGERKLGSLSENRPSRRRLDSVWDGDTGVLYCLEQGLWNFAMNTVELTYSPSVTPAFGYIRAFDKPTDWVRTLYLSDDEQFINKKLDYEDHGAYWFANYDTIYARYVSKSTDWGLDLSLWTANFTSYVEHYFASKIAKATTGSDSERDRLVGLAERELKKARATDATNETPRSPPPGSWTQSRRGSRSSGDGGSNSNLIG